MAQQISKQEEFINEIVQVEVGDKVFKVRVSEFGPSPTYDRIKIAPHTVGGQISQDAASSEESDSGSPLVTQKILNVDSVDNINVIFSGKSEGGNDNVGEAYPLNSLGECDLNGVVGGVDRNKKVVEERKIDFTDVIGTPITVNEEERRTVNGKGVDNESTSAMRFNTVVIGQEDAPFEVRRTSPNDPLSFEPALSQNSDQSVDLGAAAANFERVDFLLLVVKLQTALLLGCLVDFVTVLMMMMNCLADFWIGAGELIVSLEGFFYNPAGKDWIGGLPGKCGYAKLSILRSMEVAEDPLKGDRVGENC
ncbi:hypothetical protein V6N11_000447 [Hibiscus sabdariffa]|uniref:Uncharacterized protein n=1 Tax=Hibiscus sabdariffa TaxID=183260 RepID=A0ABR2NSZ6_9ROSI